MAVGKAENGPTTEIGQSTARPTRPTSMTQETRGKLNMNETSEPEDETQELNINPLELGLGFKGDDDDDS